MADVQGSVEARHSLRLELVLITPPSFGPRDAHSPASGGLASCSFSGQPASLSLPPSPGISNEAQFVFTIQSIIMAQKLKGTLSFIAKVCGA